MKSKEMKAKEMKSKEMKAKEMKSKEMKAGIIALEIFQVIFHVDIMCCMNV